MQIIRETDQFFSHFPLPNRHCALPPFLEARSPGGSDLKFIVKEGLYTKVQIKSDVLKNKKQNTNQPTKQAKPQNEQRTTRNHYK